MGEPADVYNLYFLLNNKKVQKNIEKIEVIN